MLECELQPQAEAVGALGFGPRGPIPFPRDADEQKDRLGDEHASHRTGEQKMARLVIPPVVINRVKSHPGPLARRSGYLQEVLGVADSFLEAPEVARVQKHTQPMVLAPVPGAGLKILGSG